MKTVNDILWSGLIDDCTDVKIFDVSGNRLTSNAYIARRYYEEVQIFGSFQVFYISYFPATDSLYIWLNCPGEVIDDDPT